MISKYDAARSCFGKQVLQKNRSAPSVGFNHDTRDMRNKTKLCMTRLDEGPKALQGCSHTFSIDFYSERL